MRVGFLGLGSMGSVMAPHLLGDERELVVWNRTASAADGLVARGAARAATPADALARDVSFSMFADDRAALAVLDAEAFAAAAGGVHVSMASLSPAAVGTLAERAAAAGAGFVAAPVLGRPNVAAAGRLNILAAGADEAVRTAGPLLELMGERIWPLGPDPRRAVIVKIAVNYTIIHTIQALGEALALVESAGVAPDEFVDLMTGTLFGGVSHTTYARIIAARDYVPPAFSMALGRKDLGLAETIAAEAGLRLPTAPLLRELFEIALADPELAEADWAALAELSRRGNVSEAP